MYHNLVHEHFDGMHCVDMYEIVENKRLGKVRQRSGCGVMGFCPARKCIVRSHLISSLARRPIVRSNQGSYGSVYLCRHRKTGDEFACKVSVCC